MARGSGIRVEIQGLGRLRERLAELAPEITAAGKKAVKESAEAIRDDAKQGVRVDSGNLRDSTDIKYEDDGQRAEIGWRDSDDMYASLHEHGTRKIPARPVLGPALEAERTKFPERIAAEVRKVLP